MTILAIVDDCTRECLALVADTSLSGFHDTENATTEEKGAFGARPLISEPLDASAHPWLPDP